MAYNGPVGPTPRLMLVRSALLRGGATGRIDRHRRGIGPNLRGFRPLQPLLAIPSLLISGFTLTGAGAALGACTVELYRVRGDVMVESVVSDGSGIFTFSPVSPGELYYAVAYKSGSPDLAGTTRNVLAGTTSVNIYLRDPTAADGPGGSVSYRPLGSPVVRRLAA